MVINLVVVALYVINFWLRWQGQPLEAAPGTLSVVAILLLIASGWLGGHMVYVHGVAVAGSVGQPLIERRKAQMPVPEDRRRGYAGRPVGQH
jgi:hypothetical protein